MSSFRFPLIFFSKMAASSHIECRYSASDFKTLSFHTFRNFFVSKRISESRLKGSKCFICQIYTKVNSASSSLLQMTLYIISNTKTDGRNEFGDLKLPWKDVLHWYLRQKKTMPCAYNKIQYGRRQPYWILKCSLCL